MSFHAFNQADDVSMTSSYPLKRNTNFDQDRNQIDVMGFLRMLISQFATALRVTPVRSAS
jgi:hypothetical protein